MTISAQPSRVAGFGLIEVMISITISLVIVLAITGLYLTQKSTYNTQDALSRVQENARFLMQVMSHDLRQAGYRDFSVDFINGLPGVDATARDDPLLIAGQNDVGTFNNSDELTLTFYGSSDSNGAADSSIVDCSGAPVGRLTRVQQRYFLKRDSAGEPALACNIVGSSVDTILVSGVESLQFLYLVDFGNRRTRFAYLPASQATIADVRDVLVSVVLRSATSNNPPPATAIDFFHFGNAYSTTANANGDRGSTFTAPIDGRIRKQFTFSVGLKSREDLIK